MHGETVKFEKVLIEFDIRTFLENLSRNLMFHQNMTRITRTVHEDLRTHTIKS